MSYLTNPSSIHSNFLMMVAKVKGKEKKKKKHTNDAQ